MFLTHLWSGFLFFSAELKMLVHVEYVERGTHPRMRSYPIFSRYIQLLVLYKHVDLICPEKFAKKKKKTQTGVKVNFTQCNLEAIYSNLAGLEVSRSLRRLFYFHTGCGDGNES